MAPVDRSTRAGLALLTAGAFALRLWAVPWEKALAPDDPRGAFPPGSIFQGHERGYVRAFLGEVPDPSMQAVPALTQAYAWLGRLSDDPRLLLVLSCLAGALCVAVVGHAMARRAGGTAGLWAAAAVALLPEHLAWSTSAYTVILPQLLLLLGLTTRSGAAATLWLCLAASIRPETALLGLVRGAPGVLPFFLGLYWLSTLGAPALGDPLLAVRLNLPLVAFLGPPVLLVGLLSLHGRTASLGWRLVAFALWAHVVGCAFFDYGPRHALAGGAALCALVGLAAARWRHLPGGLAVAGLAWATVQLVPRIGHAPPLPDLDLPVQATPAHCVEVSDEPPIPGQERPSHVVLATNALDLPADACVLWGEDRQHRAWTSRSLRPRAVRMRTLYTLTPVADRADGIRLHRLGPRWPPAWGLP